jgi:hypothetical protein
LSAWYAVRLTYTFRIIPTNRFVALVASKVNTGTIITTWMAFYGWINSIPVIEVFDKMDTIYDYIVLNDATQLSKTLRLYAYHYIIKCENGTSIASFAHL